jgi:peptidoglycan/LPS O-acetylase OafA/YrhL
VRQALKALTIPLAETNLRHPAAIPAAPSRFYRPELDGLRFLAFLAVFISHALPQDWTVYHALGLPRVASYVAARAVASGGNGVPLFFVLSSYLITTLLLREHEREGAIRLRDFYIRRALRIWPLYFVFIVGVWLLAPRGSGAEMQTTALPLYVLFLANWSFLLPAAYSAAGVAGVLWSVSVEEQFYALWPLALRRFGVPSVARVALVMVGAAWAVRAGMEAAGASPAALWLNTFAWLDAIGAGALVAVVFYRRLPRLRVAARLGLLVAGAGAWVAGACLYVFGLPFTLLALLNIGGAVLLLCGALGGDLLTSRALVFLGRISYGLYVYHAAALYFSEWLFHDTPRRAAFGLALTAAASVVSYYALELPFLKLKERFTHVRSRPDAAG